MHKISEAYTLTGHIHDSFFGLNDVLSPEEIAMSGVRTDPNSEPNHTRKLWVRGTYEGDKAYQSLSIGKNGVYYLSTVFTDPGGQYRLDRVTPNSPLDMLGLVAGSLYVCVLADIANSRQH